MMKKICFLTAAVAASLMLFGAVALADDNNEIQLPAEEETVLVSSEEEVTESLAPAEEPSDEEEPAEEATDPGEAVLTDSEPEVVAETETDMQEVLTDEVVEAAELVPADAAADSLAQFVTRLYKNVLARDPDAQGLASWISQLKGGKTGAEIVVGFCHSREFVSCGVSNYIYLNILYQTLMNRQADSAGLNSWLAVLNNGYSRDYVLAGFINSQEFANLCASMGVKQGSYTSTDIRDTNPARTAFVCRFYRICFDRSADETGLISWLTQMQNGKTAADVSWGFLGSAEYSNKGTTDKEFITDLYHLYLNRDPDSTGLNTWLNKINHGYSRRSVASGFVGSIEFDVLCKNSGVTRGSLALTSIQDLNPKITEYLYHVLEVFKISDKAKYHMNSWVTIASHIGTAASLREIFRTQGLYNNNMGNETYIKSLYQAVLGREVDAAGLKTMKNALSNGRERDEILNTLLQSKEFSQVCQKNGMQASASGTVFEGTKYNLSTDMLTRIARLCQQEQGNAVGAAAEASLMANLFEQKGSRYGTGVEGLYNYIRNSGWFSRAAYWMDNGSVSDAVINAVKDVLVYGFRTVSLEVNEHDCFSDIVSLSNNGVLITDKEQIKNRSNYIKGVTIISNRFGSRYVFYCFPTATSDPFGIQIN